MNIAFVVGASQYVSAADLPACKTDAELVGQILKATGRYTHVAVYTQNTASSFIKTRIAEFSRLINKAKIEEVFWYFSGHGDFSVGDFHYLLSDFNADRYRQTTLSNADVDNFLRSFRAKLTVKVVDACNSGTNYVKNPDAMQKHLDQSSRRFGHCYFMFSSLSSQVSYQDSELSFFTDSFCRSIANCPAPEIRFKDIIDFISDEFEGHEQQTPLFVNQALFTDTFATNVRQLKPVITPHLRKTSDERRASGRNLQRTATLRFTAGEVSLLFGHEAAEDEDPERLREYYFKSDVYDAVTINLPLRILVGHKGIGKSALFQVAMGEDHDEHRLAVLIKPDDIAGLATEHRDFLKTIRDWKDGLCHLIIRRVLQLIGDEPLTDLIRPGSFEILDTLNTRLRAITTEGDFSRRAIERFLKTPQINVYIDDLDRGWQGQEEQIVRISALLNAVRDIARENRGIFFKISLRSDVYYLVRTSDETTDKVEGSVIWHTWTNHEIFALLVKRVLTYFGKHIEELELLNSHQHVLTNHLTSVMEPRFAGLGHWADAPMYRVLMSLIRKRPRDLIKLCTLAATHANRARATRIGTKHLQASFHEYSQGRLQDTITEFRSELADTKRLLLNMKPNRREKTARQGYVYSTEALLAKIATISQVEPFRFATGLKADPRALAAFMYKINFLTARKETPEGIIRKYFEENRYLNNEFVDFGFQWEIHPAYRWALQPETVEDIFKSLQLTVDEAA